MRKTPRICKVFISALCLLFLFYLLKVKDSQVAGNAGGFVARVFLRDMNFTREPNGSSLVSTPYDSGSAPKRLQDPDTVHVAIMADEKLFPGLVTLTNSIVCNTAWPVSFHFVTFSSNATRLRKWILGSKLKNISFEIVELSENALKGQYLSRSYRADVSHPLNFARYYLQTLFPSVGKIIFLDADCLVLGDIKDLYSINLDHEHPISMLRMCDLEINYIKNLLNFSNPYVARASIPQDACILNAGVFVADLVLWDQQNISQQLEYWMTLNTRSVVFLQGDAGSGSQGPMNIVFQGRFIPLPPEWNTGAANYRNVTAKLIHFTGKLKPWRSCSSKTWKQYIVQDPFAEINICA